jgi:hypothetical protein
MRQFRGFSAWASPNFDWPRLERQVRARYRKKTKEGEQRDAISQTKR